MTASETVQQTVSLTKGNFKNSEQKKQINVPLLISERYFQYSPENSEMVLPENRYTGVVSCLPFLKMPIYKERLSNTVLNISPINSAVNKDVIQTEITWSYLRVAQSPKQNIRTHQKMLMTFIPCRALFLTSPKFKNGIYIIFPTFLVFLQ